MLYFWSVSWFNGQFYSWYLFRVIAPLLLYCIWIEFKYRVKLYSIPPPFDMPHPGNRIRHLFCPSQRLSIKMHSKIYTQCNWFYFTHLFPTFFCPLLHLHFYSSAIFVVKHFGQEKMCEIVEKYFPGGKKNTIFLLLSRIHSSLPAQLPFASSVMLIYNDSSNNPISDIFRLNWELFHWLMETFPKTNSFLIVQISIIVEKEKKTFN